MAPKKAVKKAKSGGKPENDARRTFEHLGRVQALAPLTASESETILLLMNLADESYRARQYKESADLLRAAEHLSFATLHAGSTETVSPDLQTTLTEEVEHLVERMTEHASKHRASKPLQQLRARFHRESKAAFARGSYRAALELARGAEALAHVEGPLGSSQRQLRN
jgi:hypothetical protein